MFSTTRKYFDINISEQDAAEIIDNVKKGIPFKGFNLWVLIFAIFIASLGLNVNSTAVIIGAMLISPMMGPIIGMGVSVGIADMDMFKRAFKHYFLATVVSILTATVYFLLSPISDAQSELLARTSPNLYDVLIAFFGGFAGVVAICAREKGNVITGVAIATALMPPLCTAGYGLAQGEWSYFIGALYLFFINTVFISISTIIGITIFNFKLTPIEPVKKKKFTLYMFLIILITAVPATITTVNVVLESIYLNNANKFINNELVFDKTQIIQRNISADEHTINIVLFGENVDTIVITNAKSQLKRYHLHDTKLTVLQGVKPENIDINRLKESIVSDFYKNTDEVIKMQQKRIDSLQHELELNERDNKIYAAIYKELPVVFPEINSIIISKGIKYQTKENADTEKDTIYTAVITYHNLRKKINHDKFTEWLRVKLDTENDIEIFE